MKTGESLFLSGIIVNFVSVAIVLVFTARYWICKKCFDRNRDYLEPHTTIRIDPPTDYGDSSALTYATEGDVNSVSPGSCSGSCSGYHQSGYNEDLFTMIRHY